VSGEACWIPLGTLDLGLGYENATSYPAPGQIVLDPGNHFLTIVEGVDRLRPLGEMTLRQSAQPIAFERA
jgi:hypothetical protein